MNVSTRVPDKPIVAVINKVKTRNMTTTRERNHLNKSSILIYLVDHNYQPDSIRSIGKVNRSTAANRPAFIVDQQLLIGNHNMNMSDR